MTDGTSPTPSHTSDKSEEKLPFYFTPPNGYDNMIYEYPAIEDFTATVNDYLQNLSSKKRDKALVDSNRYKLILQVLKDPRNTAISTAQFRFWVKKMFKLVIFEFREFVCHDDKPVAIREEIYNILVLAHKEAHHGGRDKTSALVRKSYSWIPKELIARFVRHCPFCISRRNGCQSTTALKNGYQYIPLSIVNSSPIKKRHEWNMNGNNYYNSISMAANVATSAAAVAVASTSYHTPTSPTADENPFDFYYSQPKECCQDSPKPNMFNNSSYQYVSYSATRSPPPPNSYILNNNNSNSNNNNHNHTSAPSAAAAAAVVAAAAIAAVNLNQHTPSSPSSVSSTTSDQPYSLVSNYLKSNEKLIDDNNNNNNEIIDTIPYITSC